ncbi:hypothetical protein BASA81_014014 [Batrachochytrium salamandrivorans]|nr:hypothetical protein BASA81_014014 [Batrachochytrium salamandrivorans]
MASACDKCWERFANRDELEAHEWEVHAVENWKRKQVPNYMNRCALCQQYESGSASDLQRHMLATHAMLACRICGLKFEAQTVEDIKEQIQTHMALDHATPGQ